MVVRAKNQGNATVLTVPNHIKVPENAEFNVYVDHDGNIVYHPIERAYDVWADNSLDNVDYDKLRQEELQDLGYNPRW